MTMRNFAIPGLALVAVLLGGCMSDDIALDDAYIPASGSERYPIQYAKGPVTLRIDSSHGSLQRSQAHAVRGFARQAMAGGVTPVTIHRPAGGGASGRVAKEIAGLMLQQGLPRDMIRTGTYPAPANAPVQLSYVKRYAHTKECGDWSVDSADTGLNEPMPNHGCAVQANIAAMIADPEDLESPDAATLVHSGAGNVAIGKIQTGQSTSTASSGSSLSTN
jgi:pilus assembly protein CpaD